MRFSRDARPVVESYESGHVRAGFLTLVVGAIGCLALEHVTGIDVTPLGDFISLANGTLGTP
jgi:hypothetical protein